MNPKKIWANLGVSDLERTTKFYSDLGFKLTSTHGSNELTSFSFGTEDFVINFFLIKILKTNTKTEIVDARKASEVVFTLSAERDQVDQWEKEIESAGGTIITRPKEFGKGYYGFDFADPDGHRFNIFYMKGL